MDWKACPRFPSYEVSEYGDVRRATSGRGTVAGRLLKPTIDPNGYAVYTFYQSKTRNTKVRAHCLVAEAFLGPKPFAKAEVCHCDGSPANNHYSNLRWDSRKGNLADTLKHGTRIRGEHHVGSKLTPTQVQDLCSRYRAGGIAQKKLAAEVGISQSQVSRLLAGQRWSHLGVSS